MKNRFKTWLNNLPVDENPPRWTRIKEFVRVVKTTSKETVLKGWKKTRLAEGFDYHDEVLQNPETEVEFLLQAGMEDLMLDAESERLKENGDISDSAEEVEVVVES